MRLGWVVGRLQSMDSMIALSLPFRRPLCVGSSGFSPDQPVARLATSSTLDVLARVHDDGGLAALRRHRERDHLAVLQHTLHLIAHKHTTLSPQLAANLAGQVRMRVHLILS